jgi:hypothetical protein
LIREVVERHRARRVLVIAPEPVARSYLELLPTDIGKTSVQFVDRLKLRELQATTSLEGNPWPRSFVAIMSENFYRQPDVAIAVRQATWDLVVVDEAHRLSSKSKTTLGGMMRDGKAQRIVMLSGIEFDLPSWLPDLRRTEWPRPPSRTVRTWLYEVSSTELAVLNGISEVLGLLAAGRREDLVKDLLRRRARSSLYAAAQTLLRLRHQLVRQTPRGISKVVSDASDTTDAADGAIATVRWTNRRMALATVTDVLAATDRVADDSKLDALRTILTEEIPDARGTAIVFSAFSDTADYFRLRWVMDHVRFFFSSPPCP